MFEILVAILLALGCPVPPNLPHGPGTVFTTQDDGDTGGNTGHIPPGTPPPPPTNQ